MKINCECVKPCIEKAYIDVSSSDGQVLIEIRDDMGGKSVFLGLATAKLLKKDLKRVINEIQ